MKTEKKQHLKGSVLFTVVSVMSLLVIFLMGTLVLATSASNRSHKNYSASQAEYTARAAIESFSQAMGRNAAVAQTVIDMSKSTSIQPTVMMENSQMGSVGYYDDSGAWVDNKINVEYVDDTYVYADGKWEEQQVLRVTATAQVGKEESTVSLYLRKKAPNEPNPLTIKGFQTLGGGGYTTTSGYISGAVSMGILDDGNQNYGLNNDSVFYTEMSFVNGTLNVGAQIDVLASQTGIGTVIMGDLNATNGNGFNVIVDYPYATRDNGNEAWEYVDINHKIIPYLYIDKTLNITNKFSVTAPGVNTVTQMRSGAPFNVFCGSLSHTGNNINVAADIYIMGHTGNSQFGTTAGTSRLNAWTDSILNKTDTQFYSEGGSIYSNENLTIGQAIIRGDVHVNGNLSINNNATIYGDLVVTGTIDKTPDQLAGIVRGTVYNGSVAAGGTGGLKEGYFVKQNTYVSGDYLKPGYVKVQNIEYPNAWVENIAQPNIVLSNYAVAGTSETGQPVDRIETVYNMPYEEALANAEEGTLAALETIVTGQNYPNATWEHFTDINGVSYAEVEIYDENGNIVNDSSLSTYYDGNYGTNVRVFYRIGETYYKNIPYIDAVTGAITPVASTSTLYFADGTSIDYVPENVTVYKSDSNGNMTNVVTDQLFVIYKADVNGNITDVETDNYITYYEVDWLGNALDPAVESDDMYSYFVPDQFGNSTEVRADKQSIIYIADINGNPTDVTIDDLTEEERTTYYATDENYTYYNAAGERVAESTAMVTNAPASYLAWYNPDVVLGEGEDYAFSYYKADPTGYEADTVWLNENEVSAAEALESVAVLPLSAYTSADNEIYPERMTREYINGTSEGGKYKIIKTLDDIKESIGCSSSGQFNANVYYKAVPGGTSGFKKYKAEGSNYTATINENAIITTGSFNGTKGLITINPNGGEIWVVLDNCNFNTPGCDLVVNGNGTVNFFIQGSAGFENCSVYTKNIYDQMKAGGKIIVREEDKVNINYYGSDNSKLKLTNNFVICGIAKCPYTDVEISETAGISGNYTYISAAGVTTPYEQAAWIGNALFKSKTGGNNFTLLYTGSNAEKEDIDNELLKQSWKVMYYDVY